MIVGQRVRQARELHRMTQTQLVGQLSSMTQPELSRIENGRLDVRVDDSLAGEIADATGTTVDWLSRRELPGLTGLTPHFRARSRTTELAKSAGLAWANLVNEAHDALADHVRALPVRLDRTAGQPPAEAAHSTRRLLGFDPFEPLPYLVLAVERLGVRVLGLPWHEPGLDAFSGWAGDVPTIAVANDVPGDRLRWTVAHELGHLMLHGPQDRGRDTEAEADRFAAQLLTPAEALRAYLPQYPTLQGLVRLKAQWGVSVKSLVRRSREMGVIDDDRASSLYRQMSARGWNKDEPGYVPREKPRALRKKLEIAYGASTSEQKIASSLAWTRITTRAVLDQHATADELPLLDEMRPVRAAHENVIPLRPGRRRA